MAHTARFTLATTLVCAATLLTVSACTGATGSSSTTPSGSGSGAADDQSGGTLYLLAGGQITTWDPQRINIDQDDQFASRVFSRTLTTQTVAQDGAPRELVGDLATDTGTPTDQGKQWSFTLRDDVAWQDGRPVTCEDVKYGISRNYATGQISGGLGFVFNFLDIPNDADGGSKYGGPYTKKGQDLYDKAVSCSGKTITFKLKAPASDFNAVVAGQGFAAYRADKDTGAKGVLSIFSDGPYMVQGDWVTNKGATFVRNPYWKADSDLVRKAYPDDVAYQEGLDPSSIAERLFADSGNDKYAVCQGAMTSADVARIVADPALEARSASPDASYVEYLAPNFKSPVMKNPLVRQAFAMSTNRGGYITAMGGPSMATPVFNILNRNLAAYRDFTPFGAPANGDPAAAKQVLQSSGLTLPVPITVTYNKNSDSDKAFAAMAQTWEEAGFKVTLNGFSDDYYGAISTPEWATKADVFWTDWAAYWPSGASVIPLIFDSRTNLTADGSGNDPGYYDNPEINEEMDAAATTLDATAREQAWGDISEKIADDGGYVAIDTFKFYSLYGSGVKNFATNSSGFVDLAGLSVR